MKDIVHRLLGRLQASAPAQPAPATRPRQSPVAPLQRRVAMIIHNPLLESKGNVRLNRYLRWHDPDQLAREYIHDLRECSGGIARYEIVERVEVDDYPVKADGFRYDDERYLRCWQQQSGFHQPDKVDYLKLIETFDLIARVEQQQIDEVWLFAFPYAGYYESTMAGAGAFWCNSPPVPHTGHCKRRFVIMGFNYERDAGPMLESFGHRVESIMAHVYRNHHGERNLWDRFTRYDKVAPGQAECGNVHFAPNSQHDYDWGNQRTVPSRADTWYGFPDLSGKPRMVDCHDWGSGDTRGHHFWWLDHLPRTEGETDGVSNNWWQYVLDPNRVASA